MRKYYLIGIIVVAALIVASLVYVKVRPWMGKDAASKPSTPREMIVSLLPPTWVVTTAHATTPLLWSGAAECQIVQAEHPLEEYDEPHVHFRYHAWHNFWFCPRAWEGGRDEVGMTEQVYPASLLCDCADYKIFHLTLGENSQPDLPKKVKDAFER